MQRRCRFIASSAYYSLRASLLSSIYAHNAIASNVRYLHISRSQRSRDLSNSTSSTVEVVDTPVKIVSASGGAAPPEDSEEPGDREALGPNEMPLGPQQPVSPGSFARPGSRARGRPRGCSSRRSVKTPHPRKSTGFKHDIPEWFISRNVTLSQNNQQALFSSMSLEKPDAPPSDVGDDMIPGKLRPSRIAVSPYILKELEAHLSAALLVQPGQTQELLTPHKTHVHLKCQEHGAIYFLDEIIENAADVLEADIVRLDGQDLDELLETLIGPTIPGIGVGRPQIFFTNIMREHFKDVEQRDELSATEENEDELEEDEEAPEESTEFKLSSDMPMRLFRLLASRPMYASMLHSTPSLFPNTSRPSNTKESTEIKLSAYLDLLVSAPVDKRRRLMKKLHQNAGASKATQPLSRSARTIIYLRDFQSIFDTPRGHIAHQSLLHVVHNRRRLGERIVLVISDDLPHDNVTFAGFPHQYYHTIKIPTATTEAEKIALQEDRYARVREINLRSIQSAIRQRSRTSSLEFDCPVGIHLDALATSCIDGLGKEIWEANKVQRIASVAIGNHGRWLFEHDPKLAVPIALTDIARAVSDVIKADMEQMKPQQESKVAREAEDPSGQPRYLRRETHLLPTLSSKDCNKHEQKLLSGVIDPDKIHVGFSDIRAPESTIQALKVLVSLPLKRPDAFSYGVLSKNFINGVLLFGPPGTGKTMLAKAVAKESGARVLEIKGSEVYDMYVGEGEKNVKAIFSLARKLSPCVVFIDEVDTIFSTRNASERHISHREIINQFMAEWDGINALNSGVLILGATNRPFDLDDAILRRMPRRILVDLPTEEDRFAIFHLLLADEALDSSVDLKALAKRTNLYSGSDLKNVCVSAAIAAVVEEKESIKILQTPSNDGQVGDAGTELKLFDTGTNEPKKRVLRPSHFEKALTEVTPSISEHMETIELLRKFDRQYGNAKDKKKMLIGFGSEAPQADANVRALNRS